MVTCESESVHSGFRLGRAPPSPPRPCSASSLTLYKQKIDALFDDNRSVISLGQYGPNLTAKVERRSSKVSSVRDSKHAFDQDDPYTRNKINNSVQDRIERMFAAMATDTKGSVSDAIGVHTFSVDYLGSTPLNQKVTSLAGLQVPLKNLYFAYKKNRQHSSAFTGQLEISKNGLKVQYQGERGDLEQQNPFPTIAVWSAVKFVVQADENNAASYAFLPLITDPDNIDKHLLFQSLEPSNEKYILSHNENSHSPIFAVVMRKLGASKKLECHGFVCQTSEDAIVVAATLYKSLMSHMSRQKDQRKKKLKNLNGVSCMSVASSATQNENPVRPPRKKRSTSSVSCGSETEDNVNQSKDKADPPKRMQDFLPPLPPPPPPPPKLPKSENILTQMIPQQKTVEPAEKPKAFNDSNTVRSKVSEKIELFTEMEKRKNIQRPPTLPPPIPVKLTETKPDGTVKEPPLRRNLSGRQSLTESGDILTKVAIPRSNSILWRDQTRYKSIGQRNNGKKSGGSPLGFNELFNEFRIQENLHSMDEILNAIIDPEGMSFNDLKPIYKEFLLKLAVTYTKDEMFQHSKAIMKKQKKKILRRNSTFQNNRRKMFKGAHGLRLVFRLPFGKPLKQKNILPQISKPFEFQNFSANIKHILNSESSVSTSSYDLRQFHPKEPLMFPPKRTQSKRRASKKIEKIVYVSKLNGKISRPGERTSTSEDSDFLTVSGRLGCQNRNSSSGYVSCSECESESCVDRCYCSLKDECKSKCYCSATEKLPCSKSKARDVIRFSKECCERDGCCYDANCEYVFCDCDSESCTNSNKCYCLPAAPPPNLPMKTSVKAPRSLEFSKSTKKYYTDRLRQAFDDSYYEPARKPQFRPRSNSMIGPKKRYEEKSRKSFSSDNLALDYALFLQNKKDMRKNSKRLTVRSNAEQDPLSVKKTAEMAALFADVHLSQRTDVRNRPSMSSSRNLFSSKKGIYTSNHFALTRKTSLEDSLGYLP